MATTRKNATAKKSAGRPGSRASSAATKTGGKKTAAAKSQANKTGARKAPAKKSVQTKSAGTAAPKKRGSGPATARKTTTKASVRTRADLNSRRLPPNRHPTPSVGYSPPPRSLPRRPHRS